MLSKGAIITHKLSTYKSYYLVLDVNESVACTNLKGHDVYLLFWDINEVILITDILCE